jgi:uncharacterized protein with PIN domain
VDRRTEGAFRRRLEALARSLGAEAGSIDVEALLSEARRLAVEDGMPSARALVLVYERARDGCRGRGLLPTQHAGPEPRFLCDASLGGLARWLRAAGYEAQLAPEVPIHRLPDEAHRRGLVLLTTDTEVLDRRLAVSGSLRLVWLPSSLTVQEKLGFVLRDLALALREPRCMACGGTLVARAKESVSARIPPRTARWKDEYFVCVLCDRLFWQGTHWQRIVPSLRAAAVAA